MEEMEIENKIWVSGLALASASSPVSGFLNAIYSLTKNLDVSTLLKNCSLGPACGVVVGSVDSHMTNHG